MLVEVTWCTQTYLFHQTSVMMLHDANTFSMFVLLSSDQTKSHRNVNQKWYNEILAIKTQEGVDLLVCDNSDIITEVWVKPTTHINYC